MLSLNFLNLGLDAVDFEVDLGVAAELFGGISGLPVPRVNRAESIEKLLGDNLADILYLGLL